jgi:hypothetical protein
MSGDGQAPDFMLIPKLSRTYEGWVLSLCVLGFLGILIFSAVEKPSNVLPLVIIVCIFGGFLIADKRLIRIAVSGHRIKIVNIPGPRTEFDRSKVSKIVALSMWVVFVGIDGKEVAKSRQYWTRAQLEALAVFLDVPLEWRKQLIGLGIKQRF